jgi:hypothetical protein
MKRLKLWGFLRVAQRQEARRPRFGVRGTPPPCFLQEYDSMGVKGWGCAKNVILWELGGKQLNVDPSTTLWARSLKLKRDKFGEQNAETQSALGVRGCGGMRGARRGRVPEREAGRSWRPMFTVYVTATRDNLSRYSLCSNDSNGVRMGRKLVRGIGIRGNLGHENGLGVDSAKARIFFGSELRKSQPQDPGAKPAPGAPGGPIWRRLNLRRGCTVRTSLRTARGH